MVALPRVKPATYVDLLALPEHLVGEIVDDELHASPRPSLWHAVTASALGEEPKASARPSLAPQ